MYLVRLFGMVLWLLAGLATAGLGLAAEIQLNNREFGSYEQQGSYTYPNIWLKNLLECEDTVAHVCRVEQQFLKAGNLTADTQIKASAGFVHTLICGGTDAAATAGQIVLYDSLTETGTIVYQWDVQAVAYPSPVVIPLDVVMLTGIYLGFTTTADMRCTVVYR